MGAEFVLDDTGQVLRRLAVDRHDQFRVDLFEDRMPELDCEADRLLSFD